MRILLVNSSAYPCIGGVENSLRYMGSELVRAGNEVKLFCLQLDLSEPFRTEYNGIEIIRCKYSPSRWPHVRAKRQLEIVRTQIRAILNQFEPESIWSRSAAVGLGAALSGYKGKLFHIFPTTACMDSRGMYLNTAGLPVLRRLKMLGLWPFAYISASRIERELMMRCVPICFSENMRRQLVKTYGRLAEKTKVIRPGVDTEHFCREKGEEQFSEIKQRYGLSENEMIAIYVGRLSGAKGIPMLIEAVGRLRSRARLVLVGSGPEEARLHRYIEKWNLSKQVVFVGQQYELLPGFYTMARTCVLPSLIESFGQSYLEAMACGTPAVGFAADGRKVLTATDEIVEDGKTGCIVRQVGPQALADGINSILEMSSSKYRAMSKNAAENVKQRFSWRQFVEEMLAS